jgi:hypothetical protein
MESNTQYVYVVHVTDTIDPDSVIGVYADADTAKRHHPGDWKRGDNDSWFGHRVQVDPNRPSILTSLEITRWPVVS